MIILNLTVLIYDFKNIIFIMLQFNKKTIG